MLDYLFDPNYKAAKNKYNTAKSKVRKLNNIKNDITNDSSSVNTINKQIDYIYEDFVKAVSVSDVRSRVHTKLSALREPHQTADGYLNSACGEIDDEIRLLNREMNKAETKMNNIKNK